MLRALRPALAARLRALALPLDALMSPQSTLPSAAHDAGAVTHDDAGAAAPQTTPPAPAAAVWVHVHAIGRELRGFGLLHSLRLGGVGDVNLVLEAGRRDAVCVFN